MASLTPPLLEGTRAAFFDLFDTLITIEGAALPALSFAGAERPSTIPLVYEELRKIAPTLTLEKTMGELINIWREIEVQKKAGPEEVSAPIRFARLVGRLGIASTDKDALAKRLTEVHMRALAGAARPVEGAAEILGKLRERGLPLVLISNFDYTPAARWILEGTRLAEFFPAQVISDAVGLRKPHERLFEEAARAAGVPLASALHVGDKAREDAWGASRLGIRAVWINPAGAPWQEPGSPPALTLRRFAELALHI